MKQLILVFGLLVSTIASAVSIPPEFEVNWVYDGIWANKDTYIYKTVGHRGEDEFVSNLCRDISFYPIISKSGNEYSAVTYDFKFTNAGLTLSINSKEACLPTGTYHRIK